MMISKRILLVDDNEADNVYHEIVLRRAGYSGEVVVCESGEEALEYLRTHIDQPPELVLLDINMPGMDGYEVLEVFRTDDRLKGIPVIAVTANAMPRDIERGRAAGFADYLTKPIDVTLFLRAVDNGLNRSEEARP